MDGTDTRGTPALAEAARIMTICNSCRYCEGLCAVFPAMERHREFSPGTLAHLASLCHGCGACLDDCQFAPPHEFAVNVPRTMAAARRESYAAHAWPRLAGGAFDRGGIVNAAVILLCVTGFLAAIMPALSGAGGPLSAPGAFYRLMSHGAMVAVFGLAALCAALMIAAGIRQFWRAAGPAPHIGPRALAGALHDAMRLRYLDGGGAGCPDAQQAPRDHRRLFHHFVFYGFLLCFASTCVATLYSYGFDLEAPYPPTSLPVILGALGGIGLVAGAPGLLLEKRRRPPAFADPASRGMDVAFIVTLFLLGLTGLALLVLRATSFAGILLCIHLGVVLGFFVTMPYGKFVHGIWRLVALVRHAAEFEAETAGTQK
ncbi:MULTISPECIES: tricarballylate utilization 4Fe-4S protein TcuB [Acidiphilium]|uniref:tricarballylate utilization 4Fe-4S protein TcuB n=1 Tax=Acidiphilium TaxID=522 RepID=UPI000461AB3B|nr:MULTISPECIES: tricarballylate utilization 4Fe-4S protein TcuB [Acidiphilium]KDM65985.1 citrate utilization protein B [Acidiphilium sp. JA12-A1]MBS3023618.1 tricarballylate utilization 4Fe-4S protein TcuB [Acidiphilium multivorum]